jgi:hypothetical protein
LGKTAAKTPAADTATSSKSRKTAATCVTLLPAVLQATTLQHAAATTAAADSAALQHMQGPCTFVAHPTF